MTAPLVAGGRLVPLADLIAAAPANHRPGPGFAARLTRPPAGGGAEATVTAVLERMAAAIVQVGEHRTVVDLRHVLVDPSVVEWAPLPRRLGESPERRPAGKVTLQVPPATVSHVDATVGEEPQPAVSGTGTEVPRCCGVCGQPLPRHNRRGVCTICQLTCPSCGGSKGPQSELCRACRREERPGPAAAALRFLAATGDVPDLVRELREQLLALAEYARELEEELDAQRAAQPEGAARR